MAKPKKERAKKYVEKLAINGTFADVRKVFSTPMLEKEKPKNPHPVKKENSKRSSGKK